VGPQVQPNVVAELLAPRHIFDGVFLFFLGDLIEHGRRIEILVLRDFVRLRDGQLGLGLVNVFRFVRARLAFCATAMFTGGSANSKCVLKRLKHFFVKALPVNGLLVEHAQVLLDRLCLACFRGAFGIVNGVVKALVLFLLFDVLFVKGYGEAYSLLVVEVDAVFGVNVFLQVFAHAVEVGCQRLFV